MTGTVKQNVTPRPLVKLANPVVRVLLASPLHGLLDGSVLLLHVPGRKTGRQYDIPVNYAYVDGKLIVVTVAPWRVNLRGGADVEVTSRGQRRQMHALLEEEPAAVAVGYQEIIDRLGWPRAGDRLGFLVTDGRMPTVVQLRDAARAYGWSVITLTPR